MCGSTGAAPAIVALVGKSRLGRAGNRRWRHGPLDACPQSSRLGCCSTSAFQVSVEAGPPQPTQVLTIVELGVGFRRRSQLWLSRQRGPLAPRIVQ